MAQIGKREDAVKTRKVGGKAFPSDYNWECPVCHRECRAFEAECYSCSVTQWHQEVFESYGHWPWEAIA